MVKARTQKRQGQPAWRSKIRWWDEDERSTGWSTSFLKSPHALRMANRKNSGHVTSRDRPLSWGREAEGGEIGFTGWRAA